MGNTHCFNYPINESIVENRNKDCIICWEKVESIDEVKCVRCNIYLHSYCEEIFRNGKGYCKCPHCQSIGTLGSSPFRHYMRENYKNITSSKTV